MCPFSHRHGEQREAIQSNTEKHWIALSTLPPRNDLEQIQP